MSELKTSLDDLKRTLNEEIRPSLARMLRRVRFIWLVAYSFLAGLEVGQKHWLGFAMFVVGSAVITWMTTRELRRLTKGH